MHFSEPLTALTDYALGAASLYFAVSLLRSRPPKRLSIRLWSIGFLASAIAAFVGGTYHGLKLTVDESVLRSLWNVTIYSIGVSGGFMVSGVLASSIGWEHKSTKWLSRGLGVTLAAFAIQQSGISLHNDIFHVLQIVALYFFFNGARLLKDRVLRG